MYYFCPQVHQLTLRSGVQILSLKIPLGGTCFSRQEPVSMFVASVCGLVPILTS